jgi:hypothetical protein
MYFLSAVRSLAAKALFLLLLIIPLAVREAAAEISLTVGEPTAVTRTSVTWQVSIVATGAANPEVWIYWGSTNGSTNASAWAQTNALGVLPLGDFSTNVTGLAAGSSYWYTAYATNSGSTNWAAARSWTTLPAWTTGHTARAWMEGDSVTNAVDEVARAAAGAASNTYTVLASEMDATPGYLSDKVVGTGDITVATIDLGGHVLARSIGLLTPLTNYLALADWQTWLGSNTLVDASDAAYTQALYQAAAAYGWGDHSTNNYVDAAAVTSIAETVVSAYTSSIATAIQPDVDGRSLTNFNQLTSMEDTNGWLRVRSMPATLYAEASLNDLAGQYTNPAYGSVWFCFSGGSPDADPAADRPYAIRAEGRILTDHVATNGQEVVTYAMLTNFVDWAAMVVWVEPPAATNSSGVGGMAAYAENYLYICTTNNMWKRTILSSW